MEIDPRCVTSVYADIEREQSTQINSRNINQHLEEYYGPNNQSRRIVVSKKEINA